MAVRALPLLVLLGATAACELGVNDRVVAGNYSLMLSDEGGFYLCHEHRACNGYGVLSGTVESIGWNDRYILVRQNAESGQPGWVLVDSQAEAITGPLNDEQLASTDSAAGIKALEATDAWKKLGGA